MSKELPKAYNPQEYEDEIYKKWESSKLFNPDVCVAKGVCKRDTETFSIVLPPPNVTGHLHIGHAVMLAIQDIMVRYHRMKGDKTLWVPGTDHAAIATQSKVEELLWEKDKKTRHDLGREKFLKQVEKYAQESHDTIVKQCKKMGASLDWSREVYTLDEQRTLAVRTAFKKMYDAGLIYRGHRIVNWDPKMQTTVSDDEVEWKEEKVPFYYLQYGPFIIGTARPETKFGDKYVVMHPDDKRYKKYKDGQKIELEWINGKITATVIKDKVIDMDFGTGVMTITPWHDMTDFDLAERHNLDKEQIINYEGKLLPIAGEFAGLDIVAGRKKIVEKLKEKGLLVKVEENYVHRIATNSRGNGIIEPQIKEQWFIDVQKEFTREGKKWTLKKLMQDTVHSKKIEIIPKRFEKVYFHWIDNLRDWCISRQIWYGHRIPVWYCQKSEIRNKKSKVWNLKIYGKDIFQALTDNTKTIETRAGRKRGGGKYWGDIKVGDIIEFSLANDKTDKVIKSVNSVKKVVQKVVHFKTIDDMFQVYNPKDDYPGKTIDEIKKWWKKYPELNERINKYGIWAIELNNYYDEKEIYVGIEAPKGKEWEQDPDTLDTWFSSGLWTFSPLGWPSSAKATDGKPAKGSDLDVYHPTSVMETGYDILFFWVARMILMSTYLIDDIPFEKVYLHGLIRDEKGRKMSKTLNNVIDPLDVIEKYGTDAVRLSLVIGSTPGNDVKLSEEKIAGYRNFANKLWNITRYALTPNPSPTGRGELKENELTLSDKWILDKMHNLIKEVTDEIENFKFSQAGEKLRDFTWNDFADWYLEISKFEKTSEKNKILIKVLEDLLKLWHPFMPFVTEAIWQKMGKKKLLMVEQWPKRDEMHDLEISVDFDLVRDVIKAIRNLRAENKIKPKEKVKAVIYAGNKVELIKSQAELIKSLRTGVEELAIKEKGKKVAGAKQAKVGDVEIYIFINKRFKIV